MSTELLIDLWAGIKHLIPEKEQMHIADVLVGVFDEYSAVDGIENEIDLDPVLMEAVASRFDLDKEEEVDYDHDSDW